MADLSQIQNILILDSFCHLHTDCEPERKSPRLVRCREILNLESEVNLLFSNERSFYDSITYN